MNGIEKITKRIIDEAECYAAEVKKSAEGRAKDIISDAKKKAEEIKSAYAEKAARESEAIITRAASSADILERNILLDAKSVIIDEVYQKAETAFSEISPESYFDFLVKALKDAIEFLSAAQTDDGNGEKEDNDGVYLLTLNARDSERLGKKLVASVKSKVTEQDGNIALSESHGDFSGGFKLSLGSIEASATAQALLRAAREKTEADVYGILFR